MTRYLYIGTYTQSGPETHRQEGIFLYSMDAVSGRLTFQQAFDGGMNPSFLAIHPTGKYLFAVNELQNGEVSSFSIQPKTGELTFLSRQPTKGAAPCYVSTDAGGQWLLVTNYSSGSLAVYPIHEGLIGPMADFIQHEGKGPNPVRQERAHAHSIRFAPEGRFILAADLGLDEVRVYSQDTRTGKLQLNSKLSTYPGSGPRHFDFHPNGRLVYIANELDSTITACRWDGNAGVLTAFQTLSTLPASFKGENIVADIHIHPNGRLVYVSNRGHHSLAIYEIDSISGQLTFLRHQETLGQWPRNFSLDPEGRFLIVANQYSDNLVGFEVSQRSGDLTPMGELAKVPSPVCVRFLDL
jgi:6-phosphogluconolactonase